MNVIARHCVFPILSLVIGILLSSSLAAQNLTSTVDRNQISENQTLSLTITYDGATRTDALNLSAIQQDFDVLSSTAGTSNTSINHQRTTRTNWNLVILPKRAGDLVIPSFSLGNIVSEAIRIEVLEAGNTSSSNEPMLVTLSIDKKQARVGEQVLIKVKLQARGDLSDIGGEAFSVEGANIELLQNPNYAEVRNGVNWRVVEWTYALFPQSPGNIAIPRQMFTAAKPNGNRRSLFGSRGERIAARSDAAALVVLSPEAAPATAPNASWFPASNVTIKSSWATDPSSLRAGEPMTRIIEITADAQLSAAIPPLPVSNNNPTYKEYRDQPELEQSPNNSGMTAIRRESAAVVPANEGELRFPEQVIDWWDTNTKQWRQARLPAETFTVLPAAAAQNLTPPQPSALAPPNTNGLLTANSADTIIVKTNPFWRWLAIALLIILIIETTLLVRLYWRQDLHTPPPTKKPNQTGIDWKTLQSTLQSGDAKSIHNAIISWSRSAWPEDPIHTLDSIAKKTRSREFKQVISQLNSNTYGQSEGNTLSSIDTTLIATELEKLREKGQPKAGSALPPLYPQHL